MWILISKPLYDANKTISEQSPGASVDLSKYYWYNTDTKKILPATEIPQSGIAKGQPVDPKAKGARIERNTTSFFTKRIELFTTKIHSKGPIIVYVHAVIKRRDESPITMRENTV